MAATVPRVGKLASKTTAFFLCDIQEKFRESIRYFPEIIQVAKRLVETAKIMGIPVIATEQYPKGLGNTVKEIDMSEIKAYPKTVFSMVIPEVEKKLQELSDVKSVVLFGIEAHVCVQQTALDLLERNYDVHIVADGVSARSMTDRLFSFERLRDSGAFVTTSESVMFALLGDAKHPNFKEVQKLVKTSAPDSGLLSKV
ncbi:isochorismatase domain-containing protein 2-like [Xenia sp. Carnegie-2017]|uniref:isochorismatase domain-containing protein 2-like n=1 Tax=Xenia sp. Carnegie-2017 TaxID=2897299 RepID=UPI001F04F456|nr:isochorismatase domain-containing protein 2-like [Xenia sp. Carnegie-2017]